MAKYGEMKGRRMEKGKEIMIYKHRDLYANFGGFEFE
jgi:hypothetical protein